MRIIALIIYPLLLKTMKISFFVKVFTVFFAIVGLSFVAGYFAIKFKLTNTPGIIDNQQQSFLSLGPDEYTRFPLAHMTEWVSFRIAVAKDEAVIARVSKETGNPARLLITPLVPEQMRLFFTERPFFKQVFGPLKMLGAQSQFSWGIMGIKDETAREVERRLKDPASPSYLGPQYEHLLDFKTTDPDQERFQRIIDEHDHYYAYLYAALYLKEIEAEWQHAGFDISKRPDILATLYNIGFENSKPKANPQAGGASIIINDTTYSFGGLAGMFYNSDELVEIFPRI